MFEFSGSSCVDSGLSLMFEFSGLFSFDSGLSLRFEFSVSSVADSGIVSCVDAGVDSGADSVDCLGVVSRSEPRTPGVGPGVHSGVVSVVE